MAERLYPRTVEEVLEDFKGRRAGLIKALTTDVEEFYQQCDPESENLCLFGHPHGEWEVILPAEEVPPELPEPALGINFARDGMQEKDWLSLIAVHSDTWLLAIAFYFGARFGFDKAKRKRLFNMINELPTVYEVVSGASRKQQKEKSSVSNSSSKSKSNSKSGIISKQQDVEVEEEEDEQVVCGVCGDEYGTEGFWIWCDICEKWFHGKCVKITPAKAQHIKHYKCPSCTTNTPGCRCIDGQTICNMSGEELTACRPSVTPPRPAPPSAKCCSGLSHADFRCLCSYKNSKLLPSLGIDPNLAIQLPDKCKLPHPYHC